jgi:beta-glucosidase
MELSESNKQLLDYFNRKNIPVVLILNTGRPRIVTSLVEQSDAVLQAYLSGDFGGKAIANTLLGKNNPSGKLPYTYPRAAGDIVHYDHKHTEKNDTKFGKNAYNPLFDFGHGLSYTEFEYKNFKVIAQKLPRSVHDSTHVDKPSSGSEKSIPLDDVDNGQLTRNWEIYGYTIDVDVTNTGKVAGRDVIQIYLSDEYASITPSAKRLVAFEKTSVIQPNETQSYRLLIDLEQLSFINKDLKRVVEKGEFTISINQLNQKIYFPENIELK